MSHHLRVAHLENKANFDLGLSAPAWATGYGSPRGRPSEEFAGGCIDKGWAGGSMESRCQALLLFFEVREVQT